MEFYRPRDELKSPVKMSPLTHLFGSWLVAAVTTDNARDRKLVTLAGILPDADALGLIADTARSFTSGKENTYEYYQHYHHLLLHGWPGALVVCAFLVLFARQRVRVALMCLVAYHLHLLCDLVGSRGPELSDLWPICYGEPLFRHPIWFWKGQWQLGGWQNMVLSVVVFLLAAWVAARRGYSFVELVNRRLDELFVDVLRKWRNRLMGREPTGEVEG